MNAIKFLPQDQGKPSIIISGSVDKTVRLWRGNSTSAFAFKEVGVLEGHASSINCLAIVAYSNIIVSGAADATIKIWQIGVSDESVSIELLQTIGLQPRFFPLALALSRLNSDNALILAVAGTKSTVQIHVADGGPGKVHFSLKATLGGHEGWIRSLDFVQEGENEKSDLLLASASQDKYIRLWRIHQGVELSVSSTSTHDTSMGTTGKPLSNRAHRFDAADDKYILTFEALLLGHEDWIYTAKWNQNRNKLQLLSASADNSLAIWESDAASGVWVSTTRLGEISVQKGSTTATGSTGGFWIGLWSPEGHAVVSLGRTGSWRLWIHDRKQDRWLQHFGVSGHVKDVKGIAWAKDGTYLLSTSSDQTTRLHAKWKRGTKRSWHEFARPQIHGYDLNCIDSFGTSQFISGADEKLLRVFDEPGAVAKMLEDLCGIASTAGTNIPNAANIPVLGLSNKAVEVLDDPGPLPDRDNHEALDPVFPPRKSTLDIDHPPLEELLARHTLWPEREKLYGHGYEISAVAARNDGTLVATACKASSLDHAVIRIYETREWREVKPSLRAHSLTVTCLRFSSDDQLLLSVGRDRQWTVFESTEDNSRYKAKDSSPKGHTRMILSASWAPLAVGRKFATAGRDKSVKLWVEGNDGYECRTSMPALSSVTSVDFLPTLHQNLVVLAVGTEKGDLLLHTFEPSSLIKQTTHNFEKWYVVPPLVCHSRY